MSEPVRVVRRLIVEVNEPTDIALTECVYREGINRTTVVSRAVQVYARIAANQAAGGSLVITRPDGTAERFVVT